MHRAIRRLFILVTSAFCLWAFPGNVWAADAPPVTVNGNLLIEAKGEAELYHNGRKIVLRDKSNDRQHFTVKIPERAFKAGDTIGLQVKSPVVFRAIVAAINLAGKAGQIPIKKGDWRFLGEGKDATKITAAEIAVCQDIPAAGTPDPVGAAEREKLGILPASDWVKTEKQLNGSYCIGFVLTPELLKAP